MGLVRDYKQASIVYTIWHILLRAHFQLRHDMYTITSTFPTHFVGINDNIVLSPNTLMRNIINFKMC
jgi:hypothetical protein